LEPKPIKLAAFLKLCEDEDDMKSTKVLIELLRNSGYHNDEAYASLISKDELSNRIERIDDVDSENMDDDDDSQLLFNQVDSSFSYLCSKQVVSKKSHIDYSRKQVNGCDI
jgi:hypothetical protein